MTFLIQFTVLAAIVVASVNVGASDACYSQPRPDGGSSRGNPLQIILCLINLVTTGNLTPFAVMKCMARNEIIMNAGEDKFVHFRIRNGEGTSEPGIIMNAELTSGKWQVHGTDVLTVNTIEFDSSEAATFTAMGSEVSGTEGSFEIHESGENIAVVYFDIPVVGDNIKHIRKVGNTYVCSDEGFSVSGSPTIEITCYKISNV